ncbi:MAG: T9SS type A sorting domain-containing protein [Chitinophagales bacterium]|nr:T9SS type A sorting domain-containing protein [Chitinophagales bacterium]
MSPNILTTLFLLLINTVYGTYYIKEMLLIPANPTIDDTISFVYKCESPAHPSFIFNRDLTLLAPQIKLNACHRWGMTDGNQMLYDTIVIGKLPEGSYQLGFYCFITQTPLDSNCATPLYLDAKDSAFLNFTVTAVTAVRNLEANNIMLQPNPATTQLNITLPAPTQPTTATITDVNGRVLRKEQLHTTTNTIPIANLPAGLYFIAIQNKQQRIVKKFVKK